MEPIIQFPHNITEMRLPFSRFIYLSRCQKNWEATCAIEHIVTSKSLIPQGFVGCEAIYCNSSDWRFGCGRDFTRCRYMPH